MCARLEEGDAARRTFLADVSHELRTPLTVIRAQLEAIAEGIYPADAAHLEPVLAQAATLERLVEDLRTVALAEAGVLELSREPVELGALAVAVVEAFSARATTAGVQPADSRAPGSADRGRPGAAEPGARQPGDQRGPSHAARRHRDGRGGHGRRRRAWVPAHGGGGHRTGHLPRSSLPQVFERFVRGTGSDGSGPGLAIARDIVTAHGGTIRAELPPAGGTRIVVELPDGAS